MSTAAAAADNALSPLQVARIWSLHLFGFALPLSVLLFGLTAPHPWYVSLAFPGVLILSVWLDGRAGAATRQPGQLLPGWPFDAVLYALFGLHLLNLWLLLLMVANHGFWTLDTLIGGQLLGVSAGYSGIVTAHELMHRKSRLKKLLSRILMSLVLYGHFFTEHLRGHHVRVGTAEDPATARFGEAYWSFLRRTLPAQLRSAWRLEAKRLGDADMKWRDRRMLRSRVVHGLVFEWALALFVLAFFGAGSFALYLGQAAIAIGLLECVNFFEHWGLRRNSARVGPLDSWDTDSWFTLYTLVGLSRHADHHAHPARPYQQLRWQSESPKLPSGYFGMVVMALARPRTYRRRMTEELERCRLGPFAEPAPEASDR